jgi:hypothetical protein
MCGVEPEVEVAGVPDVDDEKKKRRKEAKQDGNRPLGAMERNKALNDAMDEAYDLFDLSNREVRFALILMGGLNAALAIAVSQSKFGANLAPAARAFEAAALGVYALLALGFLLQAIDALRPGQFRPRLTHWPPDREDYPMGVRYFEDVVQRDVEAHWAAWQEVSVGQLNAELAVQVYSLCLKNKARKSALKRLYQSLRILTMLLAVILVSYLIFSFI